MHPINTAITDALTFLDTAGSLVTGKANGDFTKTAYLTSTPATTATVTVTTDSAITGEYPISFTPTAVGRWKVRVSCTHNGHTYRWEEVYDVITAAQADPAAALADASTGIKASILNATTAGASDGTVLGALLRIGRGTAYVTAPVAETTAIEVRQGDDYLNADGRALEWATDAAGDWPTLTDATVAFTAAHVYGSDTFTKAGTVVTATGATKRVRVELTAAETTGLQSGRWTYELVATLANASVVTLAAHRMTVHERI